MDLVVHVWVLVLWVGLWIELSFVCCFLRALVLRVIL